MSQNENSPRFDISTFVPLGVGLISLFGICLLLLASRLATPRAIVEVPDTATPFRYLFLGTEPGIVSPTPEIIGTRVVGFSITAQSGIAGSGDSLAAEATQQMPGRLTPGSATDSVPDLGPATSFVQPTFPTRFPTSSGLGITNTPITLPSLAGPTATFVPAATLTPTSISAPPLNAGTYDDTDSHLSYNGNWVSQTSQPGAEGGTLHVSSTLNNTITFRFIGDQLRIIYQSGSSLGTISAVIDGTIFPPLNQSGAPSTRSEWAITGLTVGTHNVTLTHSSGGSVNIDQVIVPDLAITSTPTATATPTSTNSP